MTYNERVSKAAGAKARAEHEFVQAIIEAAEAGVSYRLIAEDAGVSKARVGQIVKAVREVHDYYDRTGLPAAGVTS